MKAYHWKELLAVWLVGEGIVCLLMPSRYYHLWSKGPCWNLRCLEEMSKRPTLIRLIGITELVIGLWMATQQTED